MKMITKLMTTSTLLIAGALVSFGADMNTTTANAKARAADAKAKVADTKARVAEKRADMAEKKAMVSDSEYRDLIGQKTVGEFVKAVNERLKTNDRLNNFVMMVKERNPELAKKVEDFVKNNKDTKLSDPKIKEAFEKIVKKAQEKRAERMEKREGRQENRQERRAERQEARTSTY